MSSPAIDAAPGVGTPTWHDHWVVRAGPSREDGRQVVLEVADAEGSDLSSDNDGRAAALVTGVITNAHELGATQAGPAALVRRLYQEGGVAALEKLRGPCAVFLWDRPANLVHVARDHVGIQPLFQARSGAQWLFSASPGALAAKPEVGHAIDAVALSEWLCGWYPAVEDTAYRNVKRVPPATRLAISDKGLSATRYWDPLPADRPIDWLDEGALDEFDGLLERAVARAMRGADRTGIFLSGGLDSIGVAMAAADTARSSGVAPPVALSLAFPDAASNEEAIQTGVARQLGLEQELVPFADAAGPGGLVESALAMSAGWPQPMWNVWAPAYAELARRGRARGAHVILTGRGGDEWLTVTPYLLADQIGHGDLAGAWRLLQARRRSNNLRGPLAAARLVWRTGGRPLASAALDRVAKTWWHKRRRARLLAERPLWIGADPAIRSEMDDRIERWITPARPKGGFYVRESREQLLHPAITHDMEETQELGRRHGQRVLHPFWDVDLISMLYRVPPDLLIRDGRSKWLLRRRVAGRLPGLGLERRGKVSAAGVFRGLLEREAARAWQRLGGLRALASIGVVSSTGVESLQFSALELDTLGGAGRAWGLLNLETWVRQRL